VKQIIKNYLENDTKAKNWTHQIDNLTRRMDRHGTRITKLTADVEKAQDTIDTNTSRIIDIEERLKREEAGKDG